MIWVMPKNIKSKKTDSYIVARLQPGDDLKKSLMALQMKYKIQAGVMISSVGSLKVAEMRLASAKKSKKMNGPFEILGLNGTVGVGGIHCHLTIADQKGLVQGGHLMDGCIILTTCELVVCLIQKVTFKRLLDSQTGYKELYF